MDGWDVACRVFLTRNNIIGRSNAVRPSTLSKWPSGAATANAIRNGLYFSTGKTEPWNEGELSVFLSFFLVSLIYCFNISVQPFLFLFFIFRDEPFFFLSSRLISSISDVTLAGFGLLRCHRSRSNSSYLITGR